MSKSPSEQVMQTGLQLGRTVGITRSRPGRRGTPDLAYAVWAQRYVAALEDQSTSRAPVKFLVDQEKAGGRFVTDKQVRAYLNKARARKLLTAAPPGRPGGTLTPKAKKLLAELPE
jgi:hypothetical protein